ncbi:MAG: hypothetical protein ACI8RZ_004399 [Myxococcota bacterium]|jgi:hypothetical protein
MAVVWRGFDTALQIPCAVKILNRALRSNEGLRTRFLIEAQTMAKLRHPNIVAVQNLGEEDGCPYIVMEILEGSIADLTSASGPMPVPLAIEVITAILGALGFAHSQGVIHRDVKPGNILFSDERVFKLTDFGIARLQETNHSLTRTGASLGTWGFMAPEQRKNSRHADHRADIYAAGATLYAMVVGSPPVDLFTADRDETVLRAVPEVLRAVVAQATCYAPEDRFSDAAAMCEALEAIRRELAPDDTPYSFDLTPPAPLLSPLSAEPPEQEPHPKTNPATFNDELTGHGLAELLDEKEARPAAGLGRLMLATVLVGVILAFVTRPWWQPEEATANLVEDVTIGTAAEPIVAPPPERIEDAPVEVTPELEEVRKPIAEEPIAEEPIAEEPAPRLIKPKTGRVSVRGDATTVRLKDDGGTVHDAGRLPPGSYVILAAFGDEGAFPAGTLDLSVGERLTVRCDSVFATCTVQ